MVVEVGNRPKLRGAKAPERWVNQVFLPWSPFMAAERQCYSLLDSEGVPGPDAYDDLYDLANQAIRWLTDNPCPNPITGRRFEAQMMADRAVADTVRSAAFSGDSDAMVTQLSDLRDVNDRHAEAIDQCASR
jgi:hypothetical protein